MASQDGENSCYLNLTLTLNVIQFGLYVQRITAAAQFLKLNYTQKQTALAIFMCYFEL